MKYTALPLLTVIALSACATTAAPNTPGNPDGADDTVINQTTGLSAYPGAVGGETVPEGLDSRTSFGTDASLEGVTATSTVNLSPEVGNRQAIKRKTPRSKPNTSEVDANSSLNSNATMGATSWRST